MADDELKDAGGAESGRPKREPPTIDLDASEVSGETRAAAEAKAEAASEARAETSTAETAAAPPSKPISPWVIAPFSGAVAAAAGVSAALGIGGIVAVGSAAVGFLRTPERPQFGTPSLLARRDAHNR
jgi:hypothetical protein